MKLTNKIVMGATIVAGLSLSAFSACATDVDMGDKRLMNVAAPTASTDAVNRGYMDSRTNIASVQALVCDDTEQTLAFHTGGFEINEHHASAIGQKHNAIGITAVKLGSPGYINFDANTSVAASTHTLNIAPASQSAGNMVYRCGTSARFVFVRKKVNSNAL